MCVDLSQSVGEKLKSGRVAKNWVTKNMRKTSSGEGGVGGVGVGITAILCQLAVAVPPVTIEALKQPKSI